MVRVGIAVLIAQRQGSARSYVIETIIIAVAEVVNFTITIGVSSTCFSSICYAVVV